MKPLTLLLYLIILQISCNSSDDNKSIRPTNPLGNIGYNQENFTDIGWIATNDKFWMEANQSNYDISVHLVNKKIIFTESDFDNRFFDLEDGKLEIINRGEFGGEFNFIPSDTTKKTKTILNAGINYVFKFKGKIYFTVGSSHGSDQGGAIFELTRDKDIFSYTKVLSLDSAPEAIAIYKGKILIAGHQMFTVVENFEKNNILPNAFWRALYPNSIVVKNEDEVYIGMRGGYAKLSLNTKDAHYFKYIEK